MAADRCNRRKAVTGGTQSGAAHSDTCAARVAGHIFVCLGDLIVKTRQLAWRDEKGRMPRREEMA